MFQVALWGTEALLNLISLRFTPDDETFFNTTLSVLREV